MSGKKLVVIRIYGAKISATGDYTEGHTEMVFSDGSVKSDRKPAAKRQKIRPATCQ